MRECSNDLFISCSHGFGISSQDTKLCSTVLCKAHSMRTLILQNVNLYCMIKEYCGKTHLGNTALNKVIIIIILLKAFALYLMYVVNFQECNIIIV